MIALTWDAPVTWDEPNTTWDTTDVVLVVVPPGGNVTPRGPMWASIGYAAGDNGTAVEVTAGDTQPVLYVTLWTDERLTQRADLTGAISVTWHLSPSTGTELEKTATVDATPGASAWRCDGTQVETVYRVRAVVTYADGSVETSLGHPAITVNPTA